MVMRPDQFTKAHGGTNFGAGKVIEGEGYENNFILRHGMVSRQSGYRYPLQGLLKSRRRDFGKPHATIGFRRSDLPLNT